MWNYIEWKHTLWHISIPAVCHDFFRPFALLPANACARACVRARARAHAGMRAFMNVLAHARACPQRLFDHLDTSH